MTVNSKIITFEFNPSVLAVIYFIKTGAKTISASILHTYEPQIYISHIAHMRDMNDLYAF